MFVDACNIASSHKHPNLHQIGSIEEIDKKNKKYQDCSLGAHLFLLTFENDLA